MEREVTCLASKEKHRNVTLEKMVVGSEGKLATLVQQGIELNVTQRNNSISGLLPP